MSKINKQAYKPDIDKIRNAKTEKEKNFIERLEFIKFWAEYIKTHSDKNWSQQQNMLIDSQIESANSLFSKENFKAQVRAHLREIGVFS